MNEPWLVRREAALYEWLADRASRKNPDYAFVAPSGEKGWEAWLLRSVPKWLTVNWYVYLFTGAYDRGWKHLPWLALPSPTTDWYEWRHWFTSGRWKFVITDETKVNRILCRLRGHPRGEIYYNPGGYEPDHRCKDCGEEIG